MKNIGILNNKKRIVSTSKQMYCKDGWIKSKLVLSNQNFETT